MAEIIINRPNFLASKVGLRTESITAKADNAQVVTENERKVLKAGTIYPTNNSSAVGIIYQDVDVTDGDTAAPIMVAGHYFKDRLVGTLNADVETTFKGKGLFGENYSNLASVRPDFGGAMQELAQLAAPTTSVSGSVVSWNAVSGASGYNVYETTKGVVLVDTLNASTTTYTCTKSAGTYKYKVEALGDGFAYKTSNLSAEASVNVSE